MLLKFSPQAATRVGAGYRLATPIFHLAGCRYSYAKMIAHGLDLHGPKAEAVRDVLSAVVPF